MSQSIIKNGALWGFASGILGIDDGEWTLGLNGIEVGSVLGGYISGNTVGGAANKTIEAGIKEIKEIYNSYSEDKKNPKAEQYKKAAEDEFGKK